jgi:hypothetical protein
MNKERMNGSTYNQLKEKSWVEPLSVEEKAELRRYVANDPQMQRDWEEDVALTKQLNRLPNAPVSSNFTALVMQAVAREQTQAERKRTRRGAFWRYGWLPKFVAAAAMLCLGTFSFHEYQVAARAKLANEMKEFAETAPIPQVDWLKDFDTIEHMSEVQVADNDLLMARQ